VGNIAAIRNTELGVRPLVAHPIQGPLLDTARDRKGKPLDAGSLQNALTLHCRDQRFSSCVLSWGQYAQSVKPSYTIPCASKSTTVSLATCCSCCLLMPACGTHRRVSLLYMPLHLGSLFENLTCSALLPSSFAMYTTMLALSHAFIPPSNQDGQRTLSAVVYFILGAVLGWPFALAIAIPFVLEEFFVFGADRVTPNDKFNWQLNRGIRMLLCGAVAALILVSTPTFLCLSPR
jgi:hypothetical protein